MGNPDVRPHFQTVRGRAVVDTDEGDEALASVVEETERRCPVSNLIKDAGVRSCSLSRVSASRARHGERLGCISWPNPFSAVVDPRLTRWTAPSVEE
jgi:hypothetical protein